MNKGANKEAISPAKPASATASSPILSRALDRGIELFNAGDYGPAHEEWELVWRSSGDPERTHLKALIQVCGFFHLIQQQRFDPALRLSLRSLELFAEAEAHYQLHSTQPEVHIPGVEDVVLRVAAALKTGHTDAIWFLELARTLKAERR